MSKKNTVPKVLDFLKKVLRSISSKITQKTENDTVGHQQFRSNLDSKFYVITNFLSQGRKWVTLWFGSYEKIKIKKKERKLLNMVVFIYYVSNIIIIIFLLPIFF